MSFDLQLYTRQPPTRAAIERLAAEDGFKLELEGDLAVRSTLTARVRGVLRRRHLFSMGSPVPAEHEDLPDPVAKVIRRGGALLTEANFPWDAVRMKDFDRCVLLLSRLAEALDGVLFDPQDDRVLWPAARPARAAAKTSARTEKLIRQLSLEWYLADADDSVAGSFLDLIASLLPEATPKRFGEFEPLSHRMSDPGGPALFLEQWQKDAVGFFWKAKAPLLGGSLFRSARREPPSGARPRAVVSIDLNATAIDGDQAMIERVVAFFERVAAETGAFYGAAYVTRDVILARNGRTWHGAQTERFHLDWIGGPWWVGLPAKPAWLTWYGRAYAGLLGAAVQEMGRPVGDGVLVRLGLRPMDTDQARAVAPPLPLELVMTLAPTYQTVNAGDGPREMLVGYERSPAQVVPRIG